MQVLVGILCVFEARPEVDEPGAAPSCVTAAVGEAVLDRLADSLGERRRAAKGELLSGMEPERVRDVAVPRFRLRELLAPFHQSTVASDLRAG